MELKPSVQKYDWGKPASDSFVARLYRASGGVVADDGPFAELWMGTHPSGPSLLKATGEPLISVIDKNPSILGESSRSAFGNDLPFLLKVLSIRKALSIQAHPAKQHAEELYNSKPHLYKDPNHKPELAIALTPFKALCGFRQIDQIKSFLKEVEELRELVGVDTASAVIDSSERDCEKCLKDCFRALMKSPDAEVAKQLGALLDRLKDESTIGCDDEVLPLIRVLHSQFPDDVGCFAPFFLNILNLEPGQAIFLGPNEPHAYISGDCIECMACSDNVVRAGLTPKFKDVDTLVEMLIYEGAASKAKLFQAEVENPYCQIFKPPVPDFSVAKINIPVQNEFSLPVRSVASIFIVTSGKAMFRDMILQQGSVMFLPANEEFVLKAIEENLAIYQAMANV